MEAFLHPYLIKKIFDEAVSVRGIGYQSSNWRAFTWASA
jgi:hypothetical protein